VQATWNLLDPSAGPALAAANGAGLGVIIKEALANGRLTDRGDVPLLTDTARQLGVSTDALGLAAVLAQPWVDVVLSGASTPEMIRSNVTSLEVALDDQLRAKLETLAEDPESYWATRARLQWN
jgi:aryl-alcohol dehydrogenase-like predicted oxidoreductase